MSKVGHGPDRQGLDVLVGRDPNTLCTNHQPVYFAQNHATSHPTPHACLVPIFITCQQIKSNIFHITKNNKINPETKQSGIRI